MREPGRPRRAEPETRPPEPRRVAIAPTEPSRRSGLPGSAPAAARARVGVGLGAVLARAGGITAGRSPIGITSVGGSRSDGGRRGHIGARRVSAAAAAAAAAAPRGVRCRRRHGGRLAGADAGLAAGDGRTAR